MAASINGADGGGGDGAGKPAGLSLSFGGIKAKPKVSAAGPSDAKNCELITGIGASGVVAASGQAAAAGPRVIPKQVRVTVWVVCLAALHKFMCSNVRTCAETLIECMLRVTMTIAHRQGTVRLWLATPCSAGLVYVWA